MNRLLLVDDHTLFLEALTSLIQRQPDFAVVGEVGSVKDAISMSRSCKPDIILMDFLLPDGTGLDATEVILAELPATKIVFMTAHEEDDRLFEAIRYGAKGYLLKTTPANELLAFLRGLERNEAAIHPALTYRILEKFSKFPSQNSPPQEMLSKLTLRELDVLRELRKGSTNRQIAGRLFISEQTVKNHISRILEKLDFNRRIELIHWISHFDI